MIKILKFLLLFCSSLLFSQTILNNQETNSRIVQDPYAVILGQGFKATSSISNPFIAKIGNSGSPLESGGTINSQAGINNPSGTIVPSGKAFHDTKGNIAVNNGGQLQFTLPIALPPGIKSVAPQIDLLYISGSGNGIAGHGWSLNGLSQISRISRNIEKDNYVEGIKGDYSDVYSFNGNRLILKSGEYGKDGAEYITDTYSNIKINSYGSISDKKWKGPLYWVVTFEDGSQAWYGTISPNAIANTDLQYNITKWRDVSGNYISYNYNQNLIINDNVLIINKIEWGGNDNKRSNHFNSITFNYIDRAIKEQAYHEGILHNQSKILKNIIVESNGQQFKKYEIDYLAQNTSYERVGNIVEYNSNNESSNPINFEYHPEQVANDELASTYNLTDFNVKKYADFNRDGIADYIEFVSVGNINFRSSVYLSNSPISLSYDSTKFSASDFKNAVPITFKSNNIISNRVGLVIPVLKDTSIPSKKDLELQVYSVNIENQRLDLEYSKLFPNSLYNPLKEDDELLGCNAAGKPIIQQIESYDFNGDGISELVFKFKTSRICNNINTREDGNSKGDISSNTDNYSRLFNVNNNTEIGEEQEEEEPINIVPGQSFDIKYSFALIDLDENLPLSQSIYEFGNPNYDNLIKLGDLNGDGIQELIIQYHSEFTDVLNIRRSISNNYSEVRIGNFSGQNFIGSEYGDMLFGDFNGDSKVDLIIPIANESDKWHLYVSDGLSFHKSNIDNFIYFQKSTKVIETKDHHTFFEEGCTYNMIRNMQYQTGDLDNDGKSEIIVTSVLFMDHQWSNHKDEEWTKVNTTVYSVNKLLGSSEKAILYNPRSNNFHPYTILHYNIENSNSIISNGDIKFYKTRNWNKEINEKVIPFSTLTLNRDLQQVILTGKPDGCTGIECDKNYLLLYNYPYINNLAKISNIKQGNLTTHIEYKELMPANGSNFYSSTYSGIQYPYMEIEQVPHSEVVSSLEEYLPTGIRKQEYKYRGLVSHFNGKGILGFKKIANSSGFSTDNLNTITWSGTEIDPTNDNLPIKKWSIKTSDSTKVFPSHISINNTELFNVEEFTYKTDLILNGTIITGTINPSDKPNIVKSTVPFIIINKDNLRNIKTVTTSQYNNYYLPIITISNVNDGFASITNNFEYFNNPSGLSNNYYIGRPKSKITQTQAYNSSISEKEEYSYENNLLKSTKKWNRDNSEFILNTNNYDLYGNLIQSTISNSKDNLINTFSNTYEEKGRFVIKKIDNLGLETKISYNDWGLVTIEEDPYGNKVTHTYDNWGKILKSTSNLLGTTTYQYVKDNNNNIILKQYNSDGGISIKYTDILGQNYKSTSKSFTSGKYISIETKYDILGRKIMESEPFFEDEGPTKWNRISYDDSFFPPKVILNSSNGKQEETNILGNTTTTKELNGYTRITSKTTDALNNIISSSDKGGTIRFTYNAYGEQVKAQYGDNIVTTKYDLWGNKSEFFDPSNGLYKYEYNGFNQITKIISPKGKKEFIYNTKGQLIGKKEVSTNDDSTNKQITLVYDNFGNLVNTEGYSKGKYSRIFNIFDNQGRLISHTENSNDKYFVQKNIKYNDVGKIISYDKSLYSSGISTTISIENIYNTWDGSLYQIKDKISNKILKEYGSFNNRGQLLLGKLGHSNITNLYDNDGFLTNINHSNYSNNNILQISYSFNAIKNELNSRITGGDFNIIETFDYDDNNRLINWTDPVTGIKPTSNRNIYDSKGRILENDQVGLIKFENSSKIYQPSKIELNAKGIQNYNNNVIQIINYNENNDPIFIDGINGDVAFQYGLTNMRNRVSYGGNFDINLEGNYTKIYGDSGDFEIIKDNVSGKEKHIIYVGSSPYDSDIIYLKNYDETQGSYKFLHKDYLGSILAITDETGNKLEQRHYDAWGNFTHLQMDNGAIVTDKNIINNSVLIIDRGYTGHEYFNEVEIIHMNGRLYDPLLRRFLNADENIQEPFNTQNYNKYGYVLNNPLMFNDPSGEIFGFTGVVSAIIIGAIIGGSGYLISTAITGAKFSLQGFFKATFFGAVSGAVTFGLGSVFDGVKIVSNTFTSVLQGLSHGASQGVLSLMQGGDFSTAGMAAITGFVTSGIMSGLTKLAPETMKSLGASLAIGGVVGGATSKLAGGNFWQGAVIGSIVAGLNHAMHSISSSLEKKSIAEEELNAVGIKDITEIAPNTQKSLDKVLSTTTLSSMHKDSGKVGVKFGTPIDSSYLGETTPNADSTRATGIIINKSKVFSYYELYGTVGHELKHAIDYIKGTALANYRTYYKQNSNTAQSKFQARHEYNAVKWEVNHAPTDLARKWYNYYQIQYGWKK